MMLSGNLRRQRYLGTLLPVLLLGCVACLIAVNYVSMRLPRARLISMRKAPSLLTRWLPIRHTIPWDKIEIRGEYDKTLAWTVVVLTMNRPESLTRLLNSLQEAEYDGDTVQLVVWIDYCQDEMHDQTIRVVDSFHFRHGPKLIYERRENAGLARAWFDAWVPTRDDEYAVILEDDSAVSPQYYRWLKKACAAYKHIPEIGGISLNKQVVRATYGGRSPIINEHKPFLYKLVGTFALAPHPAYWRSYVDWVRNNYYKMEPLVEGLRTTDWWLRLNRNESIWEQWFIYYCHHHNLFILYISLPDNGSLVVNFAEHGAHHPSKAAGGNISIAVGEWSEYLDTFPRKLVHYDWDTSPMLCDQKTDCSYWENPNVTAPKAAR